jgi:hypothetical protein
MLNNTFINKVQLDADLKALNLVIIPSNSAVALSTLDLVNWSKNTFGNSQNWLAIAWNGTVFCAVGVGTMTATSPDGKTWTINTGVMPQNTNWSAIAWNGLVFCAVAGYGVNTTHAAISTDGVTWTAQTMPASAIWGAIAWNGTVFCAVAYGTTIAATSTDGINWDLRSTLPVTPTSWANLVWSGTDFLMVGGAYGGTLYLETSTDGITWTPRLMPQGTEWIDAAWNGRVFCVISTGTSIAATSPDGIVWTQQTLPSVSDWSSITWNGTLFCAVAGHGVSHNILATSPDGINWTQYTLPVSAIWSRIFSPVVSGNISLSYSKDGGNSWSTPMASIGNVNTTNPRLIWYRLGCARQWQFNITDTRIAKKVLLDAYLDVEGGTS